ncbi:hypothetical protein V6N13_078346 [Hibiscus sabdariffa]
MHPAQYRTRLCKDETNCTRRVCFFAHKPEELRPVYASTGSALPSPRSYAASLEYGMWPNQSTNIPPTLQLPTSRLKAAQSSRGKDLYVEMLSLESHHCLQPQQQQLVVSSPTSWNNPLSGELI